LFVEKSNIALASKYEQSSLYVATYISGPWSNSSSNTEGTATGNIVLVNPTGNSFSNLELAIQVDSSEVINPTLRLWASNYTLNTPNSFSQSRQLFPDMENFSVPIATISIEPNQKETISLSFSSPYSFRFNSHTLRIYISQNNFGDIINGQLLTVPQTQAYMQIVGCSSVESDEGTYHQYYNSTLKSNMVTVAYNPNFFQRYRNTSMHDYYSDTFSMMHHMGALSATYFNVTVFNNNTFTVNSIALWGQIPSRGTYTNYWSALNDYVMEPSETYIFPVAEAELPYYAIATGYVTNISAPVSLTPSPKPSATLTPSPTIPEFSWLAILPLFVSLLFCVVLVRFKDRINKNTK
jgi:hypothetical protein